VSIIVVHRRGAHDRSEYGDIQQVGEAVRRGDLGPADLLWDPLRETWLPLGEALAQRDTSSATGRTAPARAHRFGHPLIWAAAIVGMAAIVAAVLVTKRSPSTPATGVDPDAFPPNAARAAVVAAGNGEPEPQGLTEQQQREASGATTGPLATVTPPAAASSPTTSDVGAQPPPPAAVPPASGISAQSVMRQLSDPSTMDCIASEWSQRPSVRGVPSWQAGVRADPSVGTVWLVVGDPAIAVIMVVPDDARGGYFQILCTPILVAVSGAPAALGDEILQLIALSGPEAGPQSYTLGAHKLEVELYQGNWTIAVSASSQPRLPPRGEQEQRTPPAGTGR
jgi:hypothetical protein